MEENYYTSQFMRVLLAGLSGIWAMIEPALPYLLLCSGFIFLDCYSAWSLSKRVRKAHPEKTSGDTGKIRSNKLVKVIRTLSETYAVILLMYYADICVMPDTELHLAKIASGAVCGWQFWSFLENKASCNGARWAKLAQKIMVDKTARHFEINLDELKNESE